MNEVGKIKDRKMKEDFLEWIEENEASLIEDHLDTWKDEYYRKRLESIEYDLSTNYDWSCDIEWCEENLGRELDEEEKEYFRGYFSKQIVEQFYK